MDYYDQKEIRNFLQDCEKKYQVKDWQVEEVNIWPLLKMLISFHSRFKKSSKSNNFKRDSNYRKLFRNIKNVITSVYYYFMLNLDEKDYVFAGAISHRQFYNGNSMNKFFDTLMDYIGKEELGTSMLFEYQDCNAEVYKSERVRMLTKLYPLFKLKQINKQNTFAFNDSFSDLLDELSDRFGFDKKVFFKLLLNNIKTIFVWRSLWLYIFKKTKPKIAFGLCYYSMPMYGMNIACQELNIPSVDMMHGFQGPLHPCYNIKEFPEHGYALLPEYFWLWEEGSYENLKQCLQNQHKHQAFIGGNPWHLFLKNEASKYTLSRKKIILYTLETGSVPVLNDFILQAIKETKDDFQWWLRFHPRMTKEEIHTFYTSLENNNLLPKVEIGQANALALPILLKNCEVHVSKSSGSIVEAAMIGGCLNIIIDQLGKETYENLIEQGKAFYYNPQKDEDLFGFIINYIQHGKDKVFDKKSLDYKELITKIINIHK